MSDVAHPTTKKGAGGAKDRKRLTAKPQRAETRPAPHGRRITPVVDPALIKRVNEEIAKRTKVSFFGNNQCRKPKFVCIVFRKKRQLKTKRQLLNFLLKKVLLLKKSLVLCKCVAAIRRRFLARQVC